MYYDEQLQNLKQTGDSAFRYGKEILSFVQKLNRLNQTPGNDVATPFTGNMLEDMTYILNNDKASVDMINSISDPALRKTVTDNFAVAQENNMVNIDLNGEITLTRQGVEAAYMYQEGYLALDENGKILFTEKGLTVFSEKTDVPQAKSVTAPASETPAQISPQETLENVIEINSNTLIVDTVEPPYFFTGQLCDISYLKNNVLSEDVINKITPPNLRESVRESFDMLQTQGKVALQDGKYTLLPAGKDYINKKSTVKWTNEAQAQKAANVEVMPYGVSLDGMETDFNYFRYSDKLDFKEIQTMAQKYNFNPETVENIGKNLTKWAEQGLLSKTDFSYTVTEQGKKALTNNFAFTKGASKVTEKAISDVAGKVAAQTAAEGIGAAVSGAATAGAGTVVVITKKIASAVSEAVQIAQKVNTATNTTANVLQH